MGNVVGKGTVPETTPVPGPVAHVLVVELSAVEASDLPLRLQAQWPSKSDKMDCGVWGFCNPRHLFCSSSGRSHQGYHPWSRCEMCRAILWLKSKDSSSACWGWFGLPGATSNCPVCPHLCCRKGGTTNWSVQAHLPWSLRGLATSCRTNCVRLSGQRRGQGAIGVPLKRKLFDLWPSLTLQSREHWSCGRFSILTQDNFQRRPLPFTRTPWVQMNWNAGCERGWLWLTPAGINRCTSSTKLRSHQINQMPVASDYQSKKGWERFISIEERNEDPFLGNGRADVFSSTPFDIYFEAAADCGTCHGHDQFALLRKSGN